YKSIEGCCQGAHAESQTERQALMETKQPKPVTICTHCRVVGYSLTGINERCGRTVWRNERCRGVISSALNENDWKECPLCGGFGWKGTSSTKCEQCSGSGWLFVRPGGL